jgi:outer membrane lipoprotein carrier protein
LRHLKRSFFFVLIVLACSLTASAGSDDLISRLQKRFAGLGTIEAGFVQENISGKKTAPQTSSGRVYLKRPGKMRWVYERPSGDEIISNGKLVWFFQPDLNQVIERPVGDEITVAVDILSGIGRIRDDFNAVIEKEDEGSFVIGLKPKAGVANVRGISIEVLKKDFLITKTVVVDSFGSETRVFFKDIKTGVDIRDDLFEFKAEKGVTVVRQ